MVFSNIYCRAPKNIFEATTMLSTMLSTISGSCAEPECPWQHKKVI